MQIETFSFGRLTTAQILALKNRVNEFIKTVEVKELLLSANGEDGSLLIVVYSEKVKPAKN